LLLVQVLLASSKQLPAASTACQQQTKTGYLQHQMYMQELHHALHMQLCLAPMHAVMQRTCLPADTSN